MLFLKENGDPTVWGIILEIILIFLVIKTIIAILNRVVEKNIYTKETLKKSSYGRIVTITELIKKTIKFGLYFIGFVFVLDALNINTTSLIATAGIGSVAIGIGAQALVKDFINGFLIIVENQYSIGDLIIAAGCEGVVEELDVRTTKLRAFDGQLFIIPNREISVVTNKQRGLMRCKVIVQVDGSENPSEVIDLINNSLEPVKERKDIEKGPDVWGITDNLENGYALTIVAYAKAGNQVKIEYDIRQKVVETFINNNIKQPYVNNRIVEVNRD